MGEEDMGIVFVYMTAGEGVEARTIGKALIETKLAACVNIIDHMNSLYMWEGRIQEDQETVLIAKTTTEKIKALKDKVAEIHSYECPCILTFSISDGHEPFMRWIEAQVDQDITQ
jgi:periplasmic divalent cation tolerance protein